VARNPLAKCQQWNQLIIAASALNLTKQRGQYLSILFSVRQPLLFQFRMVAS